MQVLGDNDRLGAKKVNLGGNRHVLPASEKTARFPLGVLGLLPVVTARRGGTKEVVYAFKDEADDEALVEAARAVNEALADASRCAGRPFLEVEAIQIAVPGQGWGFTRAEYAPYDKRGNASAAPMRLHLETVAEPGGEPGADRTLSATVDYDGTGRIVRVGAREYRDHGNYYAVVATFPDGRAQVDKVEAVTAKTGHTKLVYKRRSER